MTLTSGRELMAQLSGQGKRLASKIDTKERGRTDPVIVTLLPPVVRTMRVRYD